MRFITKYCRFRSVSSEQRGFALPLAMGLGFVMLTIGITTILVSQNSRTTAFQRRESGASFAITEGGIARTLAQLTQDNNAVLLNRSYDTVNPSTNRTYLGPDGTPNSGDEESNAVDEWSTYSSTNSPCFPAASSPPSITYTDTSSTGTYTLRAYRYNPEAQTGTLLVEGQHGESTSHIAVTISINSRFSLFPGVSVRKPALRGRSLSGSHGNIYYHPDRSADPSLTDSATKDATNRADYLNALWSGSEDSFGHDAIEGRIIACPLSPVLSTTPPNDEPVTDLGNIANDLSVSGTQGRVTHYHVNNIELSDNTVSVDTTAGPVYFYVTGETFELRNSSRIVNTRSDSQPPQVGDLRIFIVNEWPINMFDTSCIQTAFIYNPTSDLNLQTSGDGCDSDGNSSVDGVVWIEDIVNSINSAPSRSLPDEDFELSVETSGVVTGIHVPENLASLADLSEQVGIPIVNKFGAVQNWQQVRLY